MFATWKYDRDTSEVQNIRLAYDPISARSSQHQACDRCHEKKLKCSGEKDGCDRCISSAHPCVYNRSEARCSRRAKRGSRSSTIESTTIDETLSRSASNPGSPSRRSTLQQHQQPHHRIRKGASQTRRKSNSPSAAQSRSSTEPDTDDFASPPTSAAPSVTGSPYGLASFASVSEGISYGILSPYEHVNPANMAVHHHHQQQQHQQQQQQQHVPYSMPYHDCGYQSSSTWPTQYPRDNTTSAGMSSSFLATVSNPHAFPVLTPPDEYMQFEVYSSVQTGASDFWQYRR